jgi:hypothetical protein
MVDQSTVRDGLLVLQRWQHQSWLSGFWMHGHLWGLLLNICMGRRCTSTSVSLSKFAYRVTTVKCTVLKLWLRLQINLICEILTAYVWYVKFQKMWVLWCKSDSRGANAKHDKENRRPKFYTSTTIFICPLVCYFVLYEDFWRDLNIRLININRLISLINMALLCNKMPKEILKNITKASAFERSEFLSDYFLKIRLWKFYLCPSRNTKLVLKYFNIEFFVIDPDINV